MTSPQKLKNLQTLHTLQTAGQVEECPYQVAGLIWPFSKHLSWPLLLPSSLTYLSLICTLTGVRVSLRSSYCLYTWRQRSLLSLAIFRDFLKSVSFLLLGFNELPSRIKFFISLYSILSLISKMGSFISK